MCRCSRYKGDQERRRKKPSSALGLATEMGFPVGYSELLLPRMLLRIGFFLGYLRRLLLAVFDAVGLGDLLDADLPPPGHSAAAGGSSILPRPPLGLEQALPAAVRYEELSAAAADEGEAADACAVCLCEFERRDEVRRLGNCRHVFHRRCVDRWVMENDHSTCPLCRAPLFSSEAPGALGEPSWASAGVSQPDDEYYCCSCCCCSSLTRPTLLLLHQLFSPSQ